VPVKVSEPFLVRFNTACVLAAQISAVELSVAKTTNASELAVLSAGGNRVPVSQTRIHSARRMDHVYPAEARHPCLSASPPAIVCAPACAQMSASSSVKEHDFIVLCFSVQNAAPMVFSACGVQLFRCIFSKFMHNRRQ